MDCPLVQEAPLLTRAPCGRGFYGTKTENFLLNLQTPCFLHRVGSIKICERRNVWDVEQLEVRPRFNHLYKTGVVAVVVKKRHKAVAEEAGYRPGLFPATTPQQSTPKIKVTGTQPSGRNLQICLQIRPSTADSNAWLNASKKGCRSIPFFIPALLTNQRGSTVAPIRNSSTSRAAWRPSRMAHTTRD